MSGRVDTSRSCAANAPAKCGARTTTFHSLKWLEDHPRWTFHFTPTHASWLNQIELFFSILTRRLLRRGIFTSKTDLKTQLLEFIERYNPTAKPFAWTYHGKPLHA